MATVIEVTVKTLDSQNHQFSVPEDMLVRRFKDEISATIGIPADQQRLIFRGRVLQDEKMMSEYNVANNTVHVVQRPANVVPNRNNDEPSRIADRTGGEGGGGGSNTIIMGTIGFPMDMQGGGRPRTRNSAAYRIQVGNQMLGQASAMLRQLEAEDSVAQTLESAAASAAAASADGTSEDNSTTEDEESGHDNGGGADGGSPMDIDMDDPNAIGRMISHLANAHSATAVVAALRPVIHTPPAGNNNSSGSPNVVAAEHIQASQPSVINIPVGVREGSDAHGSRPRPEAPRLREMSTLIQDVLAFQERLLPYLRYVETVLQSNRLYQNPEELQCTQYMYDTVSSIMHYLSHSFHALSDLMCDFSTAPDSRRLRAPTSVLVEQSTVLRATIPFHPGMMSGNNAGGPPPQPNQTPQQAGAVPPSSQPSANQGTPGRQPAPPNPPGQQQQQFPMFPGLGGASFGQAHTQVNISGGGGMPFNFGQGGTFQFGGGGGGNQGGGGSGGGGGLFLPDLSNILGPNLAAGVMNAAAAAGFNAAGAAAAAAGRGGTPQQMPTSAAQSPAGTPPTQQQQQGRGPGGGGGGAAQQQQQQGNAAHQMRSVDYGRPFDVILSCHSHHNGERGQRSSRPANLRRHIQVGESSGDHQTSTSRSPSEDFLLNLVDFLRNSNLLTLLQPLLKEIITNYLMRGRDINNEGHLRSCAKSLAKHILPFLLSFAEQFPDRNPGVQYVDTFSSLVTSFLMNILEITIRPPADGEYKRAVLLTCEKHLSDLMDLLKYCLAKDPSYLPKFIKLILDKVLSGTTTIFRENAAINMRDYLTSLPSQVGKDGFVPPSLVSSPDTSTVPSSSSAAGPARPPSQDLQRSDGVVPPKQSRPSIPPPPQNPVPNQSMDEDIDDLLELNSPRRPPEGSSGGDSASATGIPHIDAAFRNIPTEWRSQVRVDLQRQLVMPDQPPFSSGYTAIFSRRP